MGVWPNLPARRGKPAGRCGTLIGVFLWFNFRIYFLEPVRLKSYFPFVLGIRVPVAAAGAVWRGGCLWRVTQHPAVVGLAPRSSAGLEKPRTGGASRSAGVCRRSDAGIFFSAPWSSAFSAGPVTAMTWISSPVLLLLAVIGIPGRGAGAGRLAGLATGGAPDDRRPAGNVVGGV